MTYQGGHAVDSGVGTLSSEEDGLKRSHSMIATCTAARACYSLCFTLSLLNSYTNYVVVGVLCDTRRCLKDFDCNNAIFRISCSVQLFLSTDLQLLSSWLYLTPAPYASVNNCADISQVVE